MSVKTWGDFEIFLDRLLGRGGMGAVYMGRQKSLDRPAAIKVLKKDLTENPEFVKRFQREAALLARLVDTHVVQVFGAGEAEGQHYYAMEYVEGEDFSALVRKGHKFTTDEVLRVAESVGIALQQAWRHRIIHRDIKPSNILLTKDGQIKVMDFGLAKNPESDLTQSEVIMGTAKYMSPEQATGTPCDVRSDLYSLGVVLYELAAGQPPFTGEGATGIMYQHVHAKARPPRAVNPAVPPAVEAMILRLIEKSPEARYPSPDALISAVRAIHDGVSHDEKSTLYNETIVVGGPPAGKAAELRPSLPPQVPPSGSGALVASLAGVFAILGVAGWFAWDALKGRPDPPPVVDVRPPPAGSPPSSAVPPPAPPAKDPDPPKDPPAPAYEEPRRKGLEAFGARHWVLAYTQLEEAERLGAKDVREKALQSHANEHLDKADAEADEETALQHYASARKFVDDDAVRERIKSVAFRRWRKSAERSEGGDWSKAAEDWRRAEEFADENQRVETRERREFCAKFADAVGARTRKEWAKALDVYKDLAKNPRGYSVSIELEIRRAETEIARSVEMAAIEVKKEFEDLMEQGRRAWKKAAWAESRAFFDRTAGAKFSAFPRDEAQRALVELSVALAAPPGMVYVPAGRFTMGGGRPVESPEGEVDLAAFYIDDHETTVAEYGEFLKAVEAGGVAPIKDLPTGKSHVPPDWTSLKPVEPVTGVDWWDAAAYAAWKKRRLPREAEWERTAGFDPAGRRPYPWGPKYQKDAGRSFLGVDGLGSGTIEWTADWFKKYPWSPAEHVDFGERKRALRGGVLLAEDAAENAKVTFRHCYPPAYRSRKIGFRCAMDIPEK